MRTFLASFFFTILFLSSIEVQSQELINYTIKEGLPSNTIYCLEQDDKGFIWFGTDAGLSRFDGREFRNYSLQEGLPDMDILNFYKDSKGRIWMYTFNGRVSFIEDGKIYSSANAAFLKHTDFQSRITGIEDKDGKVYVTAYKEGHKILDELANTVVEEAGESGINNYFLAIANDVFYKIVITSSIYEVYYLPFEEIQSNPNWIPLNVQYENLASIKIVGLSYAKIFKNNILGITQSSTEPFIFHLNLSERVFHQSFTKDLRIYNFDEINDKVFLFTNLGIKSLDMETFKISDYFNYQETTDFIIDAEGNYWITTLNDGVIFQSANDVKKNRKDFILVKGLYNQNDSNLFIINDENAVLRMDQKGEFSHLFDLPNKSYLKSLHVDSISQVWTLNSSGLRVNGTQYSQLYRSSNLSFFKDGIFVFQLPPRPISYLNVSSTKKIDFDYQDLGKIWDFEFSSSNEIILACENGLFLMDLDKKTIENYAPFDRIRVTDIEIDKYDNVWLGTNGLGLVRVRKDSIDFLNDDEIEKHRIDNFFDVYARVLLVDSVVYASSPRGVSKVTFGAKGVYEIYHITESNGLIPARINDLTYFNGKIYVAQDNGLFYFDHEHDFQDKLHFPIIIDEFIADDSIFNINSSNFLVPYGTDLVQINCMSIYYRDQQNLKYQFKLSSDSEENDNWNNSDNSQFIFPNLPSGKYKFQVRVRSTNSEWTESAGLSFEVDNVFWRTIWFLLLLGVFVLSIFIGVYIFYNRLLERRKALKREKIASDLKALKAQINPHFLFNSLNSIQSFILEENNEKAEKYLVMYGKLMRTILNHSNELTVAIKDEIASINLYIELEKLRLSKPLDFVIEIDDIDPQMDHVPSMIIQPLIENSIWHGIQTVERRGKIILTFRGIGKEIMVSIEDNGKGISSQDNLSKQGPHGVQLVRERIELINRLKGITSNFEILSNEMGTRVSFTYPFDLN
ncbi:histidine kinase [Ekhidna sp.]|uniref:sensor histidine kinase n=1 Tax=Ekhidna sp. TaxID=2608089 RepID=UPI003BABE1B7